MAPKAPLHNRLIAWLFCAFTLALPGCSTDTGKINGQAIAFVKPDASKVPADTVSLTDPGLHCDNGIFFFKGKAFSGLIKEVYENGTLKSIGSYLDGKQYGVTRTFYPGGGRRDVRSYKDNRSYGRHFGFWENGKKKFDFFYVDDRQEGIQRQWYPSGQIYLCLTMKNDSETGRQRGWRENGKLFANYEVKDGIRYGLQKTNLCYTLRNEKLNLK